LEVVKCLVNAGANLHAKNKVQFTKSLFRAMIHILLLCRLARLLQIIRRRIDLFSSTWRKDKNEAIRWYRLAAEQGYARGQNHLGVCYANGSGVRMDKKEAVRLYRLSAGQGNQISQFNLGWCYRDGLGVKINTKEAAHFFRLSAAQGFTKGQHALNKLVYHEQGKLMFLLSYHKRLGSHSSITLFFAGSSIYEPALLPYIFDLAGKSEKGNKE